MIHTATMTDATVETKGDGLVNDAMIALGVLFTKRRKLLAKLIEAIAKMDAATDRDCPVFEGAIGDARSTREACLAVPGSGFAVSSEGATASGEVTDLIFHLAATEKVLTVMRGVAVGQSEEEMVALVDNACSMASIKPPAP